MNQEEIYKIKQLLIDELIQEGIIPKSSKDTILKHNKSATTNKKKITEALLKRMITEVINEKSSQ